MKRLFLILLAALSVAGCQDDDISASGRIITENRSLRDFDRINILAGRRIKVVYGNDHKISIKGSDNLVSRLRTNFDGDKMNLEYDAENIRREDLDIVITVPYFQELRVYGDRKLTTEGTFRFTEYIDIFCVGESDFVVQDPFVTDDVHLFFTGTGRADIRNLAARTGMVVLTGDGRVHMNVADTLEATIVGNGSIYYMGNPEVPTSITGSGSVSKI